MHTATRGGFPSDNILSSEEILVFEEYESQETVSGL